MDSYTTSKLTYLGTKNPPQGTKAYKVQACSKIPDLKKFIIHLIFGTSGKLAKIPQTSISHILCGVENKEAPKH